MTSAPTVGPAASTAAPTLSPTTVGDVTTAGVLLAVILAGGVLLCGAAAVLSGKLFGGKTLRQRLVEWWRPPSLGDTVLDFGPLGSPQLLSTADMVKLRFLIGDQPADACSRCPICTLPLPSSGVCSKGHGNKPDLALGLRTASVRLGSASHSDVPPRFFTQDMPVSTVGSTTMAEGGPPCADEVSTQASPAAESPAHQPLPSPRHPTAGTPQAAPAHQPLPSPRHPAAGTPRSALTPSVVSSPAAATAAACVTAAAAAEEAAALDVVSVESREEAAASPCESAALPDGRPDGRHRPSVRDGPDAGAEAAAVLGSCSLPSAAAAVAPNGGGRDAAAAVAGGRDAAAVLGPCLPPSAAAVTEVGGRDAEAAVREHVDAAAAAASRGRLAAEAAATASAAVAAVAVSTRARRRVADVVEWRRPGVPPPVCRSCSCSAAAAVCAVCGVWMCSDCVTAAAECRHVLRLLLLPCGARGCRSPALWLDYSGPRLRPTDARCDDCSSPFPDRAPLYCGAGDALPLLALVPRYARHAAGLGFSAPAASSVTVLLSDAAPRRQHRRSKRQPLTRPRRSPSQLLLPDSPAAGR